MPGWSIGTSRYERPLCFGASRSVRHSTKNHCAQCASDVHTFWPVITHSSPSSSARVCTLARSEPAFGLRVALAPDLGAAQDAGEERGASASSEPKWTIVGPSRPSPTMPTRPGPPARGVLLVEDHLLDERGAAPAVLRRPAEADPAGAAELLLPRPALLEQLVLVAGTAAPAHHRELTVEPVGEPGAGLGTEGFLLGGEAKVQGRGRYPPAQSQWEPRGGSTATRDPASETAMTAMKAMTVANLAGMVARKAYQSYPWFERSHETGGPGCAGVPGACKRSLRTEPRADSPSADSRPGGRRQGRRPVAAGTSGRVRCRSAN